MLQRSSVGLTRPPWLSTGRNRTSCAVVVHSSHLRHRGRRRRGARGRLRRRQLPAGELSRASRRGDRPCRECAGVRCLHALARAVRLSGPTGFSIGGQPADQDLAGWTRSHFPRVQVRHPRLRSPAARAGITVQCRQPPGAGTGPALRVLHAHAPSHELPRPRPRRSLHPPLRGRPASAAVRTCDESVRERRAKFALRPQPASRQLLTPRARSLAGIERAGEVTRVRVKGPRPGACTSSLPSSGL